MTRDEAWQVLTDYTKSDSLRKHALAVEAAMAWYAKYYGEPEEVWRVVGLLHDFDYELYPTLPDHPLKGAEILNNLGLNEQLIRAISSHVSELGLPRESLMEKALFAVDELTGFLTAVALVRPSKKIAEVEAASVKKKMKDKAFARSVNRQEIHDGAALLGIPLEQHIANVVAAMTEVASDLGL